MVLLVDENAPDSVARFLADRGHNVHLVREVLPAGVADPVVAAIGDRLSATVVSWDKDFKTLVSRIPHGSRTRFRRLGRISFRCRENNGKANLERWIDLIELHYEQCLTRPDSRMIVEIQENGLKII